MFFLFVLKDEKGSKSTVINKFIKFSHKHLYEDLATIVSHFILYICWYMHNISINGFWKVVPEKFLKQDGPSLESSSYLSLSLRYLGSLGPWDLGTPGPWNPWTLGLLDLFPPPTPPHSSPYILKTPPISASYPPPLVWFGYGGGRLFVKFDN